MREWRIALDEPTGRCPNENAHRFHIGRHVPRCGIRAGDGLRRGGVSDSCAVCHGPEARATDRWPTSLQTRPADLTRLAEKNGGEFPYYRVFAVIDGRYIVPGHGERDMPVWGRQFLDDDVKVYGPNGGEIVTTERIHELAGYVQSLQR